MRISVFVYIFTLMFIYMDIYIYMCVCQVYRKRSVELQLYVCLLCPSACVNVGQLGKKK